MDRREQEGGLVSRFVDAWADEPGQLSEYLRELARTLYAKGFPEHCNVLSALADHFDPEVES